MAFKKVVTKLFLAAKENDLFLNIVLISSLISAGAEYEERSEKGSPLLFLLKSLRCSKCSHRLSIDEPAFFDNEVDF